MPSTPIELQGSVWMTVAGENFGGHQRILLLSKIAEYGSITQAAKAINLSYKAAWDAIDTMNNLAGEPLVARVVGGKGGGGTGLTQRGQQLIHNFSLIEHEHQRFIQQLSQQASELADDLLLLRKISMKTSARNQFTGTLTRLQFGAVNDEIELEIGAGQYLIAIITHESTVELGLTIGSEVLALIQASSIILATEDDAVKFSARNRLSGQITRLQVGAVNTEVVLDLADGRSIAAIITNESSALLGLTVGSRASALFKASCVILATPN